MPNFESEMAGSGVNALTAGTENALHDSEGDASICKGCEAKERFDPIAYINEPRWQASRLGLERIRLLLDLLGRPQDRLRFVHVAGTNGKGSTCAFLASILQVAGYRTGLFTSPFIQEFEERIRVDGKNISYDDLTRVTLQVAQAAERVARETGDHPTEFELMTAVALLHFEQQACAVVVLEVGLGGRLDSTNVIEAPEVCVITRLGLDHTQLLGDTLARIAGEKAGIIKPGSSVVSYPHESEAMEVVQLAANQAARATGAASGEGIDASSVGDSAAIAVPDFERLQVEPFLLSKCGYANTQHRSFTYKGKRYQTQLLASYQPCNAALAIEAANALQARGWDIAPEDIQEGIRATVWPGRFELVHVDSVPDVAFIVDGGHNRQGAQALVDTLKDVLPDRKVFFVMGVLADKDYVAMLELVLPLAQELHAFTPPNPRALPACDLIATANEIVAGVCAEAESETASRHSSSEEGLSTGKSQMRAHDSAAQALQAAVDAARSSLGEAGSIPMVVCFGSLYSLAEVKAALATTVR